MRQHLFHKMVCCCKDLSVVAGLGYVAVLARTNVPSMLANIAHTLVFGNRSTKRRDAQIQQTPSERLARKETHRSLINDTWL